MASSESEYGTDLEECDSGDEGSGADVIEVDASLGEVNFVPSRAALA